MSIASNNEIILLYWIGVLRSLELKISLFESKSIKVLITNNLPLLIYS